MGRLQSAVDRSRSHVVGAGRQAVGGVGVIVIGRNEGHRLVGCLRSLAGLEAATVYVDSGSSDGSPARAAAAGVEVLELDGSRPFSAARARNEGLERLRARMKDAQYVQFIDGDCQLHPQWLARAQRELASRPEVAAVCGRLREQYPEASVYNRLCDMDWHRETGETAACGGIFMVRAKAFEEVGGFRGDMIAGEEAELCLRLRGQGWKIVRLEEPMAWHDAQMTRFGQWWRRTVRTGHAMAESVARHGRGPERHKVRAVVSTCVWGAAAPMGAVVLAALGLWHPWWVMGTGLIAAGYALLFWRIYRYRRRARHDGRGDAVLFAGFCVLGKFPQTLGVMRYAINRVRGRGPRLIEYK